MTNALRFRKEFQLQPRQMSEADVREKADAVRRLKGYIAWRRHCLEHELESTRDKRPRQPESPASDSSD